MKNLILIFSLLISSVVFGQISINKTVTGNLTVEKETVLDNTLSVGKKSQAESTALLDMVSTTKGILIPRMNTTERDAILSPATSLMIFNTTDGEYQFYDGVSWSSLGGGGGNTIYTADDALISPRTVIMSGNSLTFSGGQTILKGSGSTNATTSLQVENSSAQQMLKIDDSGGFVVGIGATIGNEDCIAIGTNADATDNASPATNTGLIAIGLNSAATGAGNISIGEDANSSSSSAAIGLNSNAVANSIAFGRNANAANTGIALGRDADASNTRSISIGPYSESSRFGSIAIGYLAEAKTSGNYNMALGASSIVTASNSVLISTKGSTQTNSTANTFEVNLDNATSIFRFGNTVDGWLNSTGGFAFGTTIVESSAALQVDSTTKGFLPPRMTTTERDAISTPAAGLVIFNTTTNKHEGYDGTTWNAFY